MTLVKDLKNGIPRQIPCDQYDQPLYVEDLVTVADKLVRAGKTGVYHAVGPEFVNRYEFAIQIAKNFGYDVSLIAPVKSVETGRAPRPLTCNLKTGKIMQEINFHPMTIIDGLLAAKAKVAGGLNEI